MKLLMFAILATSVYAIDDAADADEPIKKQAPPDFVLKLVNVGQENGLGVFWVRS
jgi:hypothetical protein